MKLVANYDENTITNFSPLNGNTTLEYRGDVFYHSIPMEEASKSGHDLFVVNVEVYYPREDEEKGWVLGTPQLIRFGIEIKHFDKNNLSTVLDCIEPRVKKNYVHHVRYIEVNEHNEVKVILHAFEK